MEFDEKRLMKIAENYLKKCRPGDFNHAMRVVKWVKILGKNRPDLRLLLSAAYLHDIGWFGIVPDKLLDLDEMLKLEPKANANTEKMVRLALRELEFNEKDICIVLRLINAADEHYSHEEDEAIIVDADNLSKLCIDHFREKYKPESYLKLLDRLEKDLTNRIATKKGKELYPKLIAELKKKLI